LLSFCGGTEPDCEITDLKLIGPRPGAHAQEKLERPRFPNRFPGVMNEITSLTSTECRAKAEAKLALADRGGAARDQLLVDAEAWLILADHLDFVARNRLATAKHNTNVH